MLLEAPQNPRRSLRTLPAPDDIPGDPWALRTTKQAAELLGIDPACLCTWTYRGLGPRQEPRYFRGSVKVYRLDCIAAWLSQRQGLTYEADAAWAEGLKRINFEPEPNVRDQVRRLVELLGPEWVQPPGCRWRSGGFEAYLRALVRPADS